MLAYYRILLIALLLAACTGTQKIGQSSSLITENLKTHIQYLADDKLEGRRTGTKGEELAREYITEQFRTIGLSPKGTEYFAQNFMVNDGKVMDDVTQLVINGNTLVSGRDFFVYPFSPDKYLEASPAIALQESNMPWFFDLGETLENNKSNPHFDLVAHIREISKGISPRGATAVLSTIPRQWRISRYSIQRTAANKPRSLSYMLQKRRLKNILMISRPR
jgi:hypothetical protein